MKIIKLLEKLVKDTRKARKTKKKGGERK